MKSGIIISTLLSSVLAISSLQAANLTVIIDNVDIKRGGNMRVGLFSPQEKFLSNKPFQGQEKVVKTKKLTFIFKNIPAGQYAITSFQDINGNKKIDTNFFGMPVEPYSVSGKPRWGKPEFKPASFLIGSENKTITLQYD
ncbi:MAG: DUF2141 domain-containing protein [Cocleimonas sp.]|nr:DUF2141 domain-containing protein [Cocleimonas sp.]